MLTVGMWCIRGNVAEDCFNSLQCRCKLAGKTAQHVKVEGGVEGATRVVQARCRYACFGVAGL